MVSFDFQFSGFDALCKCLRLSFASLIKHSWFSFNSLLVFWPKISLNSQATCQNDDGHCVWYGKCATIDTKVKNCAYSGPPKALNASGIDALKQWCSHLLPENYRDGQEVLTCCDNVQVSFCGSGKIFETHKISFPSNQLNMFNDNIKMAAALLNRCPSCMHNFVQQVCDFTCSPRQSQFVEAKVTKIDPKTDSESKKLSLKQL